MLGYLRQSTASQARVIGPFVDDTDFKTPETGLTIANTDVKLLKNGAASVNKNSGGGTHRANGNYGLTFDATDTDTVGELHASVLVAGALLVVGKFVVLEEAVYDSIFVAGAVALATAAALDAVDNFVDTEVAAIKAKTDLIPALPAAVGDAMTLTAAYDFAKGTVAMTEAYAANGVAPTPAQALYAIQQMLTMFSIAGTSLTVKKLDNSTTAFVVTLNSATAPTAAART